MHIGDEIMDFPSALAFLVGLCRT